MIIFCGFFLLYLSWLDSGFPCQLWLGASTRFCHRLITPKNYDGILRVQIWISVFKMKMSSGQNNSAAYLKPEPVQDDQPSEITDDERVQLSYNPELDFQLFDSSGWVANYSLHRFVKCFRLSSRVLLTVFGLYWSTKHLAVGVISWSHIWPGLPNFIIKKTLIYYIDILYLNLANRLCPMN